jgi:hypothetical protein
MAQYGILPSDISNVNETGFCIGVSPHHKVIRKDLSKKIYMPDAQTLWRRRRAVFRQGSQPKRQIARASYKLAILYSEMDRKTESNAYRKRAVDMRTKLRPEEDSASFDEEDFMKLCPWMLW